LSAPRQELADAIITTIPSRRASNILINNPHE
jgi:hypothetical protein